MRRFVVLAGFYVGAWIVCGHLAGCGPQHRAEREPRLPGIYEVALDETVERARKLCASGWLGDEWLEGDVVTKLAEMTDEVVGMVVRAYAELITLTVVMTDDHRVYAIIDHEPGSEVGPATGSEIGAYGTWRLKGQEVVFEVFLRGEELPRVWVYAYEAGLLRPLRSPEETPGVRLMLAEPLEPVLRKRLP